MSSSQLISLFRLTPRRLQWLDEQGIVPTPVLGHRRHWDKEQAVIVGIIAELRRKGVSMHRIRKYILKLEHAILWRLDTSRFVVAGGKTGPGYPYPSDSSMAITETAEEALKIGAGLKTPFVLVDIHAIAEKVDLAARKERAA